MAVHKGKTMRNYWSCSKLADWIRGTSKPDAMELGAWSDWEQYAQATHPVRYWLVEHALDTVQRIIYWPADQVNSVRYWLNNRFVARTHALTSSSLKPGAYHELDTRILHCVFDELVNFVEVEKAWMQVCFGDKATRKKYALPFWRQQWWTRWFMTWRNRRAGLDHLAWEMSLTNKEYVDPEDPNYGELTSQAVNAKEVYALYFWWTVTRPARPDPYAASGWTAYCEASREANGGKLFPTGKQDSPELQAQSKKTHDKLTKLEASYEAEDEAMLINLIKVRRSLWT
jgi:hypothetical protein